MARPNQLFLLADHIKLSLLERRRAQSLLNADAGVPGAGDTQNAHIARSLDQFQDGLQALEEEARRLEEAGDQSAALAITDSLPKLKRQLETLTSQFHGFSTPDTVAALTHPNDPSLSADFAHATSTHPARKPSSSSLRSPNASTPPPGASAAAAAAATGPKTVRFRDSDPNADPEAQRDQRTRLFSGGARRYRDDPAADDGEGYAEAAQQMDNQQIHAFHERVLADQDAQLDALGESIGRQRELGMRIGDELDEHIAMLDEVDGAVTRQQGRLTRAGRQLGKIAKGSSGEGRALAIIVVLILILVLLIVVFK